MPSSVPPHALARLVWKTIADFDARRFELFGLLDPWSGIKSLGACKHLPTAESLTLHSYHLFYRSFNSGAGAPMLDVETTDDPQLDPAGRLTSWVRAWEPSTQLEQPPTASTSEIELAGRHCHVDIASWHEYWFAWSRVGSLTLTVSSKDTDLKILGRLGIVHDLTDYIEGYRSLARSLGIPV